jgi:Kef-type K+ transport system membrane component KefB
MNSGFDIFRTLNWDVAPSKTMYAYALLAVWAAAIVFLILAWINANKTGITEDQKKYNNFIAVTLLILILCIYLTTAIGA